MTLNPYTLYLANCRDGPTELAKMYCIAQRQASLDYLNFYNLYQSGRFSTPSYTPIIPELNPKLLSYETSNVLNSSMLNNNNFTLPDSFYEATRPGVNNVKSSLSNLYEPYKKLKVASFDHNKISATSVRFENNKEMAAINTEQEESISSNSGNTLIPDNTTFSVKLESSTEQNSSEGSLEEEELNVKVESKDNLNVKRLNPALEASETESTSSDKIQKSESKKNKKSQKVKIQSKWKNIPGRIISGIQRACRHYFAKNSGIKLDSIALVLEAKGQTAQDKFAKFIKKYKTSWKTWSSIARFVSNEGDDETTNILMELIRVILNSENDFEIWLSQTKMSDVTKTHIRASRDQFEYEFLERLVHQTKA